MTLLHRTSSSPRRGFSLVEMLVVILVIVIVASITVVVVNRTRVAGNTARIKSDMIAISMAIDQFKADHKGLPGMVPNVPPGILPGDNSDRRWANSLAYCLLSPEPAQVDGLDGPGFRVGSATTKRWPAYLDAGKFSATRNPKLPDGTQLNRGWEILDAFGSPIVYLPRRKPNIRPGVGVLSRYPAAVSRGAYDAADVEGVLNVLPGGDARKGLLMALGDRNTNGIIDDGEPIAFTGDYILMSAGFDREFFTGLNYTAFKKADDVYNFDR